ncbi:MAG: YdeI/OmpD-associated family protein, partial [Pseudomonadota bacterium]
PMDIDGFERVEIAAEHALWEWLADHHDQAESVWVVTWKAAHRERYVSRDQMLDALIAFGWIDGRRMKLDEDRTMQLISPRRETRWTESYKARADRLDAEGRMRDPGRRAIAESKARGHWDTSAPIDALETPEDLLAALARHRARSWWDGAAPSYRRNVLRWIAYAKRPETRAKRIESVAEHAARGEKVPQY